MMEQEDVENLKRKITRRIKWDEEVIAEHNLLRGTRQKIDEPATPYNRHERYIEDNLDSADYENTDPDEMESSCETESDFGPVVPRSEPKHEWKSLQAKLNYHEKQQQQQTMLGITHSNDQIGNNCLASVVGQVDQFGHASNINSPARINSETVAPPALNSFGESSMVVSEDVSTVYPTPPALNVSIPSTWSITAPSSFSHSSIRTTSPNNFLSSVDADSTPIVRNQNDILTVDSAEEKARKFRLQRQAHYNEFQVLRAMQLRHEEEDDDDDEGEGSVPAALKSSTD